MLSTEATIDFILFQYRIERRGIMTIIPYGNADNPAIMMLHGGGLSWWNYRKEAELLSSKYYVLLPVIEGHAQKEDAFVSIEDSANRLIRYIEDNLEGNIKLLCGLSLGAQIAAEMIAQKNDICDYAVIESVSLIPSNVLKRLIRPTVSLSYGLIQKKWFSKLQFQALHIDKDLYEDYYRDTCRISKENMIAFLEANTEYSFNEKMKTTKAVIRVIVGGKEQSKMIRSAKLLCDNLANGTLEIKEGLYHGEYSLNQPEIYVQDVLDFISDSAILK